MRSEYCPLELEIVMTVQYDHEGNVLGYTCEHSGEPELVTIEDLDKPKSARELARKRVIRSVVGALNEEFGFPPIPGMDR